MTGNKSRLGSYVATTVTGEPVRAFVPPPLPAGWSETQAKKGWDAVPDCVSATLPKKAQRLIALGKTDKETRKHLIRGRLVDNIQKGKDGGAQSAKILGSDTELNLWQPETQSNQVIISISPRMSEQLARMTAELEAADPQPEGTP